MRNFHAIAAVRGDGLRPELQALFDRSALRTRHTRRRHGPGRSEPRCRDATDKCHASQANALLAIEKMCHGPSWFAATSADAP